jgi:RNA polymerase sigma-70 factor (ECF subfamily)
LYIEGVIGTQPFVKERSLPDPRESAPRQNMGTRPAAEVSLAEACANGEIGAFEQIYQLYGSRMKSVAWNLLGNETDAEDAVQEAFLKAFRGREGFQGQASLATWLHRIVVNTCLDARRRAKRHPEDEPIEPETPDALHPSTGTPHHPLRMALEKSLLRLGEKQRTAFVLYEVEGFSHAEIAAMLEISEAASKNRLFEAKRELREMLKRLR